MTRGRDPRDLLEEMIEEIQFIGDVLMHQDIEDFLEDMTSRHAVERALEILGEAAKGLPKEVVQKYGEVPWSDMTKMRDVLIHAYHRVEPRVVWNAAVEHALPLLPALQKVRAAIDSESDSDDEAGG